MAEEDGVDEELLAGLSRMATNEESGEEGESGSAALVDEIDDAALATCERVLSVLAAHRDTLNTAARFKKLKRNKIILVNYHCF